MTTNDTEAGSSPSTAEPLALRLNDQLGHTLGMALVDEIANDGHRNAAGGIYATSVQDFAREVQRAFAQQNGLLVPGLTICREDGRCQYAIDHGAEGLGHCPRGKCAMPDHGGPVA